MAKSDWCWKPYKTVVYYFGKPTEVTKPCRHPAGHKGKCGG